jgi:hypothetical protein
MLSLVKLNLRISTIGDFPSGNRSDTFDNLIFPKKGCWINHFENKLPLETKKREKTWS